MITIDKVPVCHDADNGVVADSFDETVFVTGDKVETRGYLLGDTELVEMIEANLGPGQTKEKVLEEAAGKTIEIIDGAINITDKELRVTTVNVIMVESEVENENDKYVDYAVRAPGQLTEHNDAELKRVVEAAMKFVIEDINNRYGEEYLMEQDIEFKYYGIDDGIMYSGVMEDKFGKEVEVVLDIEVAVD